ncbi:hypothetical protein CFP71_00335 [Amycolatopsis thailandensis]|uniref:Methionyl-tRNA formyltransferase n=1 Tax=Amycolatopsis thailandensis TaxID=589330 RepID=A0A229SJ62_9PSEU|nr:hypothetical protein CFP71_00335 [Amycolatopsis thailandensis]
MARVTDFFKVAGDSKPHPTEVECGYRTVITPTGNLLQLSTYGSDDRQSEKKVSQTLQFDREAAERLIAVVRGTFPEL